MSAEPSVKNLNDYAEGDGERVFTPLLLGYLIGRAMHEPDKFTVDFPHGDTRSIGVGGDAEALHEAASQVRSLRRWRDRKAVHPEQEALVARLANYTALTIAFLLLAFPMVACAERPPKYKWYTLEFAEP